MRAKAFDFHGLGSSCGTDENFYGVRRVCSQRVDFIGAASTHITLPINELVQTLLPRTRDLLETTWQGTSLILFIKHEELLVLLDKKQCHGLSADLGSRLACLTWYPVDYDADCTIVWCLPSDGYNGGLPPASSNGHQQALYLWTGTIARTEVG